ncbi:MAG TPA: acetyl-CoA carboxylase biotin carboxylase subunit [Ktedonobacterales bacterium]
MGTPAMSKASHHRRDPLPQTITDPTLEGGPGGGGTPAQRTRLIRKVLVANRGEIACRVLRTCRAMGIATVAVFSDADSGARHVREADEAVRIGPAPASASYLNIPALIAAARHTGADAVHPGYGFLAEHADFAAACRDAGLTFIGPAPEAIARMGSKREAKREMSAAGVPVIPGDDGADQSDAALTAAAAHIGYPLLVKASAGGGGKGMRTVQTPDELGAALAAARREAAGAFGDETLLLEKLLGEPRHVEFQIFGDAHGNVIHLGERECSIQRRHQKVVEETPSPAVTPELRARMGEAAVTVGKRLGYTGAGTVEFLLDEASGAFYFLEVNTRLQVEHPVTELVTGLDLVRWQILVAEGHPLPLAQDEVRVRGHAVEVRLYAEDPANDFLPATGTIALWREPAGEGVRVDAGIARGDRVSPYYDPLLAKLCAWGESRAEALRRLERALAQTTLLGVRNNRDFLRRTLLHPAHLAGRLSTGFIEHHAAELLAPSASARNVPPAAAIAVALLRLAQSSDTEAPPHWRNNPSRPLIEYMELADGGGPLIELRLLPRGRNRYAAALVAEGEGITGDVLVHALAAPDLTLELDGHLTHVTAVESEPHVWWVKAGDEVVVLRRRPALPERALAAVASGVVVEHRDGAGTTAADAMRNGVVAAPMPGLVVAVPAREGAAVCAGEPLVILEAMKMEQTVRAPRAGIATGIRVAPGDQVTGGAPLLELRGGTS